MMLVGWPHIVNYLRTGKTAAKAFPPVDEETVEKLKDAGLPVKYVPELDNLPRITEGDVLKWMKVCEWRRMCTRKTEDGKHIRPKYPSLWY